MVIVATHQRVRWPTFFVRSVHGSGGLPGGVPLLEGFRAEIAQRLVQTLAVVEDLNVPEEARPEVFQAGIAVAVGPLALE